MPRKFDVKGTREYFYWSLGLALLAAWAIRDGWAGHLSAMGLDSLVADVLEKHPDYPRDGGKSFYWFNRILAVLAGIGSIVCGIIHRIVR